MHTYLVIAYCEDIQRIRQLVVNNESPAAARIHALQFLNPLTDKVRSVTDINDLTISAVPEKHSRKNWVCYKIEKWPLYKADLDITDPENSIMVSCFDPTEFRREDLTVFKDIILKHINKP